MRRGLGLTLALYSIGASVLVAGYGLIVGTLGCLDSCSTRAGDWAENRNAWQWDAAIGFSAVLLLGAVLLLTGIAIPRVRNLGLIVAVLALAGQFAALSVLWELITSSYRKHHLKDDFLWLAITIVTAGVVSIVLRMSRHDE